MLIYNNIYMKYQLTQFPLASSRLHFDLCVCVI